MTTIKELQQLEITALVDLLAKYTEEYTHLLIKGATEAELSKLRLTIKTIQAEIDVRNNNTTDSGTLDYSK